MMVWPPHRSCNLITSTGQTIGIIKLFGNNAIVIFWVGSVLVWFIVCPGYPVVYYERARSASESSPKMRIVAGMSDPTDPTVTFFSGL